MCIWMLDYLPSLSSGLYKSVGQRNKSLHTFVLMTRQICQCFSCDIKNRLTPPWLSPVGGESKRARITLGSIYDYES